MLIILHDFFISHSLTTSHTLLHTPFPSLQLVKLTQIAMLRRLVYRSSLGGKLEPGMRGKGCEEQLQGKGFSSGSSEDVFLCLRRRRIVFNELSYNPNKDL